MMMAMWMKKKMPPPSIDPLPDNNNDDNSNDSNSGVEIPRSPSFVEQQYVHDVYEEIAHCFFSADSNRRWPNVVNFLDSLPRGSLVCDVGCGDGKYMATEACHTGRLSVIGVDVCANLLRSAYSYSCDTPACDVVAANNLCLSFRDACFDAVISVGVLHHFSTQERRLQALEQLARLLTPNGGRLLVYVWALEQPRRNFSAQDILVPSHTVSLSSVAKTKSVECSGGVVDPVWPTRNGHQVVFEEFPNWPDAGLVDEASVAAAVAALAENILTDAGNNSDNNNNTDTKAAVSSGDENNLKKARKNSLPGASTKSGDSSSILDRLLPPFLRSRASSKTNLASSLNISDSKSAESTATSTATTTNKASSSSSSSSPLSSSLNIPASTAGNGRSLYRYYHVFQRGELEKLVDSLNKNNNNKADDCTRNDDDLNENNNDNGCSGARIVERTINQSAKPKLHLKVVRSFYDHANWAVELERVY